METRAKLPCGAEVITLQSSVARDPYYPQMVYETALKRKLHRHSRFPQLSFLLQNELQHHQLVADFFNFIFLMNKTPAL